MFRMTSIASILPLLPMILREGEGGGGGGSAADGGGAAAAGAAGDGGGAFDWGGALGGDFETLKPVIEGDKLTDPGAAVRAYAGLKTKADGMIALPGKDAKPEDWDGVWEKLGRPKSPDEYDLSTFAPPEGLPWSADVQKAVVGRLHKRGLTAGQLPGVLADYAEEYVAANKQRDALADEFGRTARAGLEKEWGPKFKENYDLVNRAAKAVFGDAVKDATKLRLEDGRYLLDEPRLAKALLLVAERMAEAGHLDGAAAGGGANADGEVSTEAFMAEVLGRGKKT